MVRMPSPRPFRAAGAVLSDARGEHRALQVTWHAEVGVVVLSAWKDNVCTATVRLYPDEAASLIETLAAGLAPRRDPGLASA